MSSFFEIKNLLTAYHRDKPSTGKIIEPKISKTSIEYYLFDRCFL